MEQKELLAAILDSLTDELVFVDNEHIIRYVNQAGKKKYAKFGDILGKSIFACHKQHSAELIKACYVKLQAGENDILFSDNEKRCVYMRAVRNENGQLLGYYERYWRKQQPDLKQPS
jgi:DUF438 domain-containing protein